MCAWLPDTTIHHLPPPLISPRHKPSSSYLLVTERALLGAPTRYHLPELLCNLTPAHSSHSAPTSQPVNVCLRQRQVRS